MEEVQAGTAHISRGARFSVVILVIMVNVLITFLVFRHEDNVKFPPLISHSPCEMPEQALKIYDFTASDSPSQDNISGAQALTCEYHRDGFTFDEKLKRDEIFVSRLKKPQSIPDIFLHALPPNPYSYHDRVIVNNRDIRELCGTDSDCVIYIEPNVIVRVIYRTGGNCQQDAMILARYFVHDPLLIKPSNTTA